MNIGIDELHLYLQTILNAYGVPNKAAKITSEILVEGDLRGYKNHGIHRIFQILDGITKATIKPRAASCLIKDHLSTAVIDARHSLGYPVGKQAMELAIAKAKISGLGMVGVINASHLGILSYYAELASASKFLGIVMSTSSAAVVLKGGNKKTFGTNPFSYSIPYHPYPITADFATSRVARGTIYEYLEKNISIPSDWAVDRHGSVTTSPEEALMGGLQSMDGGIKGNLLSLLISVLAGHLIGGEINPNVTGTRDMRQKPNKGDLFLALNIEAFTEMRRFEDKTKELVSFISTQKSAFRIPGSYSHESIQKFLQKGIEISPQLEELFTRHKCLNK